MDERRAAMSDWRANGPASGLGVGPRIAPRDTGGRRSLLLAIAPVYIVTFIFLVFPNSHRFPTALASTLTFSLMQVLFPLCRPIRNPLLCPLNWVTAAFSVQLVVMPLYINFVGPALGTLPNLPSDESINWAILLGALAYASFCAAYQATGHLDGGARAIPGARAGRRRAWIPPRAMIVAYALLGLIGIYFGFGGFFEWLQYFTQPTADSLTPTGQPATLTGAASSFLMPFLGFSLVMLWCRWITQRRGPKLPRLFAAPALILAIAGCYYSFNYNRGAVIAPLVALAAVYSTWVRRIPATALIAVAVLAFPALMTLGAYRTGGYSAGELLTDPTARQAVAQDLNLDETLQVYGGAPQFTAFALQATDYARHLYFGQTLLGSIFFPLPILGKPFREISGVVIYNELIYGADTTTIDQILPFQAELFMNFHLIGVALGYALVGFGVWWIQRAFERASNTIETFIWQYAGVWTAFVVQGSLAVLSQILIYFFWPVYVYFAVKRLMRARRTGGTAPRRGGRAPLDSGRSAV